LALAIPYALLNEDDLEFDPSWITRFPISIMEYFSDWLTAHPASTNLFKYLMWVLLVLLIVQILRRLCHSNGLPIVCSSNHRWKS
jgi:hypothetical protein